MKILYIDPIANFCKFNLEYYHGFYNAIKRNHEVILINDLNNIIIPDKTELIIFGLAVSKKGYLDGFYKRTLKCIQDFQGPKICFVLCLQHLSEKIAWMQRHAITHIFCESYKTKQLFRNIPASRLLFATNSYEPRKTKKTIDIGFSGALHLSLIHI